MLCDSGSKTFANRGFNAFSIQPLQRQQLDGVAMLDELIGQAQLQHVLGHAVGGQRFHHRRASTAHDATVFQRHDQIMLGSQLKQQRFIQRLGPAHIGQAGVQRLGGLSAG